MTTVIFSNDFVTITQEVLPFDDPAFDPNEGETHKLTLFIGGAEILSKTRSFVEDETGRVNPEAIPSLMFDDIVWAMQAGLQAVSKQLSKMNQENLARLSLKIRNGQFVKQEHLEPHQDSTLDHARCKVCRNESKELCVRIKLETETFLLCNQCFTTLKANHQER